MPEVGQKCDLVVHVAWCATIWEMRGGCFSFSVAGGC